MAEAPDTRSIVAEADYGFPVETVWRALTDSEWLAVWFFGNDIRPEIGHKFTIWSRPIERWDGEFKCEVLALEAPRLLSFRWSGGHQELRAFGRFMDTRVTWSLSPTVEGGTHLHFLHEGFATDNDSAALYDVMVKGSQSVLRVLAKRLPDLVEHGG